MDARRPAIGEIGYGPDRRVRKTRGRAARAPKPLKGRVCLVTGANSGIGLATAKGLAANGAEVVMLCRDAERGAEAVQAVRRATGGRAELLLCNLASRRAIHKAARDFHAHHDRLHVLIHNAGMNAFTRTHTKDGIETVFAVNVLAPFLLTALLLDTLKASAPSRVITVAGAAHRKGEIAFDNLQGERHFDGMAAARQAQLARVMFTYELARRLRPAGWAPVSVQSARETDRQWAATARHSSGVRSEGRQHAGEGVTANCVHPGAVRTALRKKLPGRMRLLVPMSLLFRTPRSGARPCIRLAGAAELEGVSGRYFERFREVRSSVRSYDEIGARRLWEVCEDLAGFERAPAEEEVSLLPPSGRGSRATLPRGTDPTWRRWRSSPRHIPQRGRRPRRRAS